MTLQDEALFFHSRRKEKVRQETEAKRWPRRRRRKQRFEIMNEADERESMAALEQRDGSQVEGAVASAILKPAFFGRKFGRGLKKRTHPGAHLEKAGADSQSQLGDRNGAGGSQGQVW